MGMANFINIHVQVEELQQKSYYFWITPRSFPFLKFMPKIILFKIHLDLNTHDTHLCKYYLDNIKDR